MKKLILSIFTVILFTNFASAQSGVDLSDRFKMRGVHLDKNGTVIDAGVRPNSVVLENPLVSQVEVHFAKIDSLFEIKCENEKLLKEQVSELESSNTFFKVISGMFCILFFISLLALGNEIQKNKK